MRRQSLYLLAAAVVLIILAVAAAIFWPRSSSPPMPPTPIPTESPADVPTVKPPNVAKIRRDGFDACAGGLWQICLDRLDRARDLDPAGDSAQRVQDARRRAREGLASAADGGVNAPRP